MALLTPPPPRTTRPPLSSVLPPIILGTATFNTQYVHDPTRLPCVAIVSRALELGITAFDTSPYYGPSEILLGDALRAAIPSPPAGETASDKAPLFLITKAGRIGPSTFDYSPRWIRHSVHRSLRRLHAAQLDLVYAHDVEFVSPVEVLAAVCELRRLRDEGVVRYVGISGYPVDVLCGLAELVLRETGEALDAVLSYGHFTVQNTTLGARELGELGDSDAVAFNGGSGAGGHRSPLSRLRAAGVSVVLNASMLGMGLLTTAGIPANPEADNPIQKALTPPASKPPSPSLSALADPFSPTGGVQGPAFPAASPFTKWHPSPNPLRLACRRMSALCAAASPPERLEDVAIRWSLEQWARVSPSAGVGVSLGGADDKDLRTLAIIGATVIGITSVAELEGTVREWRGVLDGLGVDVPGQHRGAAIRAAALARREQVLALVRESLWPALGEWKDFGWASPGEGFVNQPVQQLQAAQEEGS